MLKNTFITFKHPRIKTLFDSIFSKSYFAKTILDAMNNANFPHLVKNKLPAKKMYNKNLFHTDVRKSLTTK